jgi:hypothetical protein
VNDAGDAVKDTVDNTTKPVKVLITETQAAAMCVSAGVPPAKKAECVNKLMGKTVAEAQASVGGIVAGIKQVFCSLPIKPAGC